MRKQSPYPRGTTATKLIETAVKNHNKSNIWQIQASRKVSESTVKEVEKRAK